MVMLAVLEFVYFKMGEIGRFFGTLISGCVFKQKHNTDVQMKKTDATATTQKQKFSMKILCSIFAQPESNYAIFDEIILCVCDIFVTD